MIQKIHAPHDDIRLFGFWIYLMSDLVIFSVLFATFAVHRHDFAGNIEPRQFMDLRYLFVETMLLLLSSVAYGLGTVAMLEGRRGILLTALAVTFALGAGFIGMEVNEFRGLINAGHGPWESSFLSSFFTLVGTHGTHVSVGLLWIVVMFVQTALRGITPGVRSRLMRLGLFWHFLDIVWVGVFTVVYLLSVI